MSDRSHSVWNRPAVLALMAACAAFIAYCGTIGFQFVFDDEVVILRNPTVQSWHFVPQYFSTVFGSNLGSGVISYYRPLFLLFFRLNHALFGLNPAGYHFIAVIVHASVTALVFLIARRLLAGTKSALFVALLFAVHPVHVENVAWISCSSETLLGLAVLAAFFSWLKYREIGSYGWLAASLAFYAAAAFEKESGFVVPVLIFAYEFVYASKARGALHSLWNAIVSVVPFAPVALLYVVARAFATKGLLPHATTEMTFRTMLMTWPSVLWFYLRSMLWRFDTSAFYDVFTVATPGLRSFVVPLLAVLGTLAAVVLWAWRSRQHRNEIVFGTLFVAITISPALYIRIFLPNDFAHPRYLYLPSFGLFLLATVALGAALERFEISKYAVGAGAVLCILLAVGTLFEQQYWANNLALYMRSVEVAPHNPTARNNLGNELLARGLYDKAISEYTIVLAEHPGFWLANYNLGLAFLRAKHPDQAKLYLDRAIAIAPADPDEHYFRGVANLKLGNRGAALVDFDRATSLAPSNALYREIADQIRSEGERRTDGNRRGEDPNPIP